MRRQTIALVGTMLVVAGSGVGAVGQTHVYRPEVGKPHVDFVLPRIDTRDPVSLSDFRGKKVLLIQFASW